MKRNSIHHQEDPSQREMSLRLRKDVTVLATDIGERNVWLPRKLGEAARFVEDSLAEAGYATNRQFYNVEGQNVYNIETEIPGTGKPDEIVIIGAHYDSRCGMLGQRGTKRAPGIAGTPGANDNASGVAAILELARRLSRKSASRTIRIVAFVNEEHPFFQTDLMGSRVYSKRCRQRRENITGMIALDDLGYYTDAAKTQDYPFPFNLIHPSTGNFLAFLGNWHSRRLAKKLVRCFRRNAILPAIQRSIPALVPRIGWSDDWAFWQEGYEAITLTDTAFLRYPHYHTTEDTPDKLDYMKMASVVTGLEAMVRLLSSPEAKIGKSECRIPNVE